MRPAQEKEKAIHECAFDKKPGAKYYREDRYWCKRKCFIKMLEKKIAEKKKEIEELEKRIKELNENVGKIGEKNEAEEAKA